MKYMFSDSSETEIINDSAQKSGTFTTLSPEYIEFLNQAIKVTPTEPITKLSVDSPPSTIEKRVFIGGDYLVMMPTLREIARFVSENGFQPIIAWDFDIPYALTRDYTLRLLAQCRYAIFEISSQRGQIPEMGASMSFIDFKKLVVYTKLSKPSIMYLQTNPQPQPYETFEELRSLVIKFLQS